MRLLRPARRAFTVPEMIIGVILISILIAGLVYILIYGSRSLLRTGDQLTAQQAGRVAVARLIRELQESIEVVTPLAGASLPYAVVRDQISCPRWYYLVKSPDSPDLFELWRNIDDPEITDPSKKSELMIRGVKRLMFTTRSEGALQINLLLREGAQEFPLLTTVRMRNIAAADEQW